MRLQHNSLPFLPPASRYSALWLRHAQQSKFWDERVTYVFRLFDFWNFFSPFPFLLSFSFCCSHWPSTGLAWVKKLLRKRHRDGQLLAWSSQVKWQEIFPCVYHSTFWAFLCVSKDAFGRSLWSGHHWKDLFLLQKVSIDGVNFGQKWWRQKRKKGQGSSRAVTGGTGVNGLTKKQKYIYLICI